jgi:chromate transporter
MSVGPAPRTSPRPAGDPPAQANRDLRRLARVFGRIGLLSFGGPAAQIALMHRELVERRQWLSEQQFLTALSFCMLLPGPEAMQLATFAGWRRGGVAGGLIAGLLFVLPGAAVVLLLAALYAEAGALPWVQALFLGIKAAVVIVVIQALAKLSKRALDGPLPYALAAAAFLAIYGGGVPFPAIILAAAVFGAVFLARPTDRPDPDRDPNRDPARTALPTAAATARTVVIWGTLWLAPLGALWLTAPGALLTQIGFFFAKLAVVTFGGAYAVLAYMVQEVVGTRGWLTTAQMMDALGLAETTPGPLILVTEFVGFLAGAQAGGWALGLAAAAVTLWVTFVPCFLWIFAGAPYVDWLAGRPRLTWALAGITAAVVGVILNLSVWFAAHVLFADLALRPVGPVRLLLPDPTSLDPTALGLTALAAGLLLGLRLDLLKVLPLMALAGLGVVWATGGI